MFLSLSTKNFQAREEKNKSLLYRIEHNKKEPARIKIEEKLKCVCAPARMEKQIINFGISFQLKVTSIQHKKEDRNKTRSSCRKFRVSFLRYAKRCFYNRKKSKKKSSFIVPFFKGFFLNKMQNRVARSTAKVISILYINLHAITLNEKLGEHFSAVFYAKSHFCVLLVSFSSRTEWIFYSFVRELEAYTI